MQPNDPIIVTKLNEIIDRGLSCGLGDLDGQVCIEAAICIATGEPFGDKPTCVHPLVRAHAIVLNDCAYWSSPKVRADSLRAYALEQLGCTQIDPQEFAKRLAFENIRQILPKTLRTLAALPVFAGAIRETLEHAAEQCEQVSDLSAVLSAARSAVLSAVLSAAESAVLSAARSAVLSAAESAVLSAARSAARSEESAAWSAAESAASADQVLALAANIATDILKDLKK